MQTGLYVHVPFCETKCGYCDFFSIPLQGHQTSTLVQAIMGEMDQRLAKATDLIHTIFVGGGTPTVLPLSELNTLFNRLATIARQNPIVEFTCEANPATVDEHKLQTLVQSGVNRISLGGQSFHRQELAVLERLHNPDDIKPGVHLARKAGIQHINLDLIFGIPGQTLQNWKESLQRAIDLGTDHLSCYGLTYELNTPLTALKIEGKLIPCDHDLEADMYLMGVEFLAQNGYQQYEISNFAKPGYECRHNLVYWNNWPYYGIGPSATSYVRGIRFKNVPHLATYIDDISCCRPVWRNPEQLTGIQKASETAMLMLRLNRGIPVSQFTRQTGLDPLLVFESTIRRHSQSGLLYADEQWIRLTNHGRLLADQVISDFLIPIDDPISAVKHNSPIHSEHLFQ